MIKIPYKGEFVIPFSDPVALTHEKASEIAKADSLATMKLRADAAGRLTKGIVVEDPSARFVSPVTRDSTMGTSIVYTVMLLLFVIISLRFKNNYRYLAVVVSDLTEVRERHNIFDDTVRETSFLLLLNILWGCTAGVLLWFAVKLDLIELIAGGSSFAVIGDAAWHILVCVGVALSYTGIMTLAYYTLGCVFADRFRAGAWVKGFTSSQGLTGLIYFPLALLAVGFSGWSTGLLTAAAVIFVLAKFIFIFKGFKIFFAGSSSWMLFLYYLCSVEIVPLVLTYIGAVVLCTMCFN